MFLRQPLSIPYYRSEPIMNVEATLTGFATTTETTTIRDKRKKNQSGKKNHCNLFIERLQYWYLAQLR